MAEKGGTKLAALYAEIDLDRTKLDKALDQSVKDAEVATVKIEKSWRGLGARTEQFYENQRLAAEKNYKAITSAGGLSANELVTIEQAKAAKIQAITAKQYAAYRSMLAAEEAAHKENVERMAAPWNTLGIRSVAAIEAQKAAVISSYDTIKQKGNLTSQDLINIENAKNAKLKELNKEMVGEHEMSMASMTRAVLRFYAAWYAASAAAQAGVAAIGEAIKANLQMERINTAMKAVTDNSGLAALEVKFLREESKRLGLVFSDSTIEYTKFAAAAKNTALEGEASRKVFSGMSEAITALKLSTQDSSLIYMAMTQMMSKGKVSMEELRRQMGERLPGAIRLAAEGMGTSTAELIKNIEAGKVMAEDLLPKLAEQLHKTYGKAAMESAQQGQAQINRFNNTLFETKAMIGEAIMPAFTDLLSKMNDLMVGIRDNSGTIIASLKGIGTALEIYLTLKLWTARAEIAAFIAKIPSFIGGLNSMLGPLGLLSTAIGLVSFGIANTNAKIDESRVKTDAYSQTIGSMSKEMANSELTKLNAKLQEQQERIKTASTYSATAIQEEINNTKFLIAAMKARITVLSNLAEKEINKSDTTKKLTDEEIKKAEQLRESWEKTSAKLNEESQLAGLTGARKEFEQNLIEVEKLKKEYEDLPPALKAIAYAQIEANKATKDTAVIEKMVADSRKNNATEMERQKKDEKATTEAATKAANEKLTAERSLYKDLRKYSGEYFSATKRLIDEQAAEYRKKGIDEVAIAAWVKEETIKSYIEMGKKSDNWFDGIHAAYLEIQRDAITWGKAAYDSVKTFASSAQSTLSTVFFDAAKGKMKSFKDYWDSFADAMLKKFADICAQMLVKWAILKTGMAELNVTLGLTSAGTGAATFFGSGGAAGASSGSGALGGAAGAAVGSALAGSAAEESVVFASNTPYTVELFGQSQTVGQLLGSAGIGYGIGSVTGSIMGGNSSAQTGSQIGGTIGAVAGSYLPIPGGTYIGSVIGSVLGNLVGGLFGGGAGFGSLTYDMNDKVKYGEYPSYGTFTQAPGASEPASSEVITAFEEGANAYIKATYDAIQAKISSASLTSIQASGLADKLSALQIETLPILAGMVNDRDVIALTRETVENIPNYLSGIPNYIYEQVSPTLASYGVYHSGGKVGYDSVPYRPMPKLATDERPIIAQTGERVLNRQETEDYERGGDITIPITLNLDGKVLYSNIYHASKTGDLRVHERSISRT